MNILDRLNHSRRVKRAIDVTAAASGLVVLSPLLASLAALVRIKHGSPVLFVQARPGQHERIFKLLKFRTMTSERNNMGELLPDHERLSDFGKWLRATSLDELPELINILRGEMSLVGPRPLLVQYLSRYSAHQARRHEVPPGLTGLVQVSGRNGLTWDEKFDLDVDYIDTWSNLGDLRILLDTLRAVLKREGISADGEATMPEFLGNNRSYAVN